MWSRCEACDLLERMKQARSLSHKTIMPRKEKNMEFGVCCCWLKCLLLPRSGLKAHILGLLPYSRYMCCIIYSSTPLNITAAICVGYHVVILFRHSAYDACWSVTADVTFPIGAINNHSAAMARCGVHSCLNKLLKHFVWIYSESHGFNSKSEISLTRTCAHTRTHTHPSSRFKGINSPCQWVN